MLARQIEAKGKDSTAPSASDTAEGGELQKYQNRCRAAQEEIGKWKRLCSGFESRLASKKLLEEVTTSTKHVSKTTWSN